MTDNFLNKIVKRTPQFVFKKMGEEGVLVELTNNVVNMNKVITLNELGTFIYHQITEDILVNQLLEKILEEFDVTPENAISDLQEFLKEAEEMKILHISESHD